MHFNKMLYLSTVDNILNEYAVAIIINLLDELMLSRDLETYYNIYSSRNPIYTVVLLKYFWW